VRLWDASGRERRPVRNRGGVVHCLNFSPNGRTLVVGGDTGNGPGPLRLWDVRAGKDRFALSPQVLVR